VKIEGENALGERGVGQHGEIERERGVPGAGRVKEGLDRRDASFCLPPIGNRPGGPLLEF
jgi:hypothetical protein